MSDFPVSEADRQVLAQILAPLAHDAPCGPSARFDPVFIEIRLLREEDDPSLPMRQWERPLKLADWAQIEARCVEMLSTRSKHLQLGVWLLEAWMRQRGFAGLCQGLGMLDALLRRYWTQLHPLIEEDGDSDLRLAPLEWLNESLSVGVHVHAALLPLERCRPPYLTLADWARLTAQEMADPDGAARGDTEAPLTRADILLIMAQSGARLSTARATVSQCLAALHAMIAFLNEQLGMAAPNLSRLQATLETAERVLVQLQPEQKAIDMENESFVEPVPIDTDAAPTPAQSSADIATSGWRNRGEAYATLDAVAQYLMAVEPHSPVPFLIRRALHWGSMPLPTLIAEIIREEGDLNRLVAVLGLKI